MLDASKYITHPDKYAHDPDGVMGELEHWSPLVANRRAAEDGLSLSEEHWQVLYCLREQYRHCSASWTARQVTSNLDAEYAAAGGRRHLYELFPKGPVVQGCRIAGVPVPRDAIDPSFGSVH